MGRIFGKYIGAGFVKETPGGAVDGNNQAFSLAQTPASPLALLVHLDGVLLDQASDYSYSGQTVTLTPAPSIGQTLTAYYVKQK